MIRLKHLPRQFGTWILVGFLTVFIDFLIFSTVFGFSKDLFVSNFVAVLSSSSINYYLHRKKTFRSTGSSPSEIFRYSLYQTLVWLFSSTGIDYFHDAGFSVTISKITSFLFLIPMNFLALKFVVYRQ